MRAPLFNLVSKRRLAWLLGLLLLMPLAQTAATWHLISHVHTQPSEKWDGHSAAVADYCDMCQTAVATMGGVLATPSATRLAVAAPVAVAPLRLTSVFVRKPWPPYGSRAPPFALN